MSSKKEEKAQAAADKIKAAALSAAKGLSRAQAERAATAAARNVNAYGQKEEGPSRWQERKEAKRQMYLMSTEKAVRLGERKDLKANMSSIGGAASQCQKCFQTGHWTYECKNERVYISRPSRSQLLKNPKLRQKMMSSYSEDNPDEENNKVEEKEEKIDKRMKKSKRKYKSDRESSDSEASESESESESGSSGSDYSSESGSSYSSSSESEDERMRRKQRLRSKKQKGGKSKKYSSSSSGSSGSESGSGSDSGSESDSAKNRRSKKKRHSSGRSRR